jgi:hypothetical protein
MYQIYHTWIHTPLPPDALLSFMTSPPILEWFQPSLTFYFFPFPSLSSPSPCFLWDWGLNSGLCACKSGTLSLEPHFQST